MNRYLFPGRRSGTSSPTFPKQNYSTYFSPSSRGLYHRYPLYVFAAAPKRVWGFSGTVKPIAAPRRLMNKTIPTRCTPHHVPPTKPCTGQVSPAADTPYSTVPAALAAVRVYASNVCHDPSPSPRPYMLRAPLQTCPYSGAPCKNNGKTLNKPHCPYEHPRLSDMPVISSRNRTRL